MEKRPQVIASFHPIAPLILQCVGESWGEEWIRKREYKSLKTLKDIPNKHRAQKSNVKYFIPIEKQLEKYMGQKIWIILKNICNQMKN